RNAERRAGDPRAGEGQGLPVRPRMTGRSAEPGQRTVRPGQPAVQPGQRAVQPGQRSVQPLAAAVDVGTTGARAAAFSLDGRLVAEGRERYGPGVPRPGGGEQDANEWADAALTVLGRLGSRVARRGVIKAIGLTGQCPTVVPADRAGRPVGPGMLYRDNRA